MLRFQNINSPLNNMPINIISHDRFPKLIDLKVRDEEIVYGRGPEREGC